MIFCPHTKVCQNWKEVVELPMKAHKDKEATAAAKNLEEGMGENKTLLLWKRILWLFLF